jgi:hypothetical protein
MNTYSFPYHLDTSSPIELLEIQMNTLVDLLDCRVKNERFDLKQFTNIVNLDISEDIRNVWMPIFRNKKNIELALCVLKDGYAETILSDLCMLYLSVLETEFKNK